MEEGGGPQPANQTSSLAERVAWLGLVAGAFALLIVSFVGYVQLVDQTSDLGFVVHASWWVTLLVSLGFITLGTVATHERRATRGALIFFGLGLHLLFDINLASWLLLGG